MATGRVRARVFGEVADEYDRIRPGYPAALVDDVLAYARLQDVPALEVGAGTGKATLAFAERGVDIVAIEPDEAMAAVLARRVAGQPKVVVTVAAFEDYAPSRPFGLLFSGQAWHWMDPASRWRRAAAALAPGGALALFWNEDRLADPDVATKVLAAHREHAPEIVPYTEPLLDSDLATSGPRPELATLPEFGELTERLYRSTRTLSTVDYVAQLSTQSAHRMLDDVVRARLFDQLLERLGDDVTLGIDTTLYLARRTG